MTRKNRRHGWPAMVGAGVLMVVTLTACGSTGGSSAGATPTAGTSSRLSQLASCLGQNGVTVAGPVSASAVRGALRKVTKAERRTAIRACRQYLGGGLLSTGAASP